MGSTDLPVDLVRALSRMSGYEDGFFQTGRNNAEARFWKLKIHEEVDRRQTKSSISLGGHSSGASSREGSEQPREKSPSPFSKYNQMPAEPCDYKYSYAQPETEYSQESPPLTHSPPALAAVDILASVVLMLTLSQDTLLMVMDFVLMLMVMDSVPLFLVLLDIPVLLPPL